MSSHTKVGGVIVGWGVLDQCDGCSIGILRLIYFGGWRTAGDASVPSPIIRRPRPYGVFDTVSSDTISCLFVEGSNPEA